MSVTATEAKNRLGQVLESAQTQPVFIEKAGRRHSVVLSIAEYERLVTASAARAPSKSSQAFYRQHKQWFDALNRHVDEHGLWNEESRVW